NPKPQTPNPKPQTPNPKPQTPNPNPGTSVRLTVSRGASERRREVTLTRMSTRSIADNVRP
ncbi:hypothetical protein T484DRAFT_1622893, partial [Baffinella frigidus]